MRTTPLGYAPEMASTMILRQLAGAIIVAPSQISEGAVNMVRMAMADLSAPSVVDLGYERRAVMVGNLLFVLRRDKGIHPVPNTGNH